MLVQRIGESIGESDATFPITPPSMSRSRFGINPHRAADGSSACRPRPNPEQNAAIKRHGHREITAKKKRRALPSYIFSPVVLRRV